MIGVKLPYNLVSFLSITYFLCVIINNYLYLLVWFAGGSSFIAAHYLWYYF